MKIKHIAVAAWLAMLSLFSPPSSADEKLAEEWIDRYVGTWDLNDFLAEAPVQAELRALLGDRLGELENSLGVTGGIEYIGGALTIRGNAPHEGGEREGTICVQPGGAELVVEAALFVKGEVTVYARQPRYTFLTTCVKDWVGEVSAGHAHRLQQPTNVRLEYRPR